MAGSPDFKVYSVANVYVGCVKDAETAAHLVSFYGKGATVRFGHAKKHTLWTEGVDGEAYGSYDAAAEYMHERLAAIHKLSYDSLPH